MYLSEYAADKTRRTLKPILEVLAGIPTVIFGFFALEFVTAVLLQNIWPQTEVFNALSAGLVMGVMIIPTVASLSEDAMSAVPRGLREGAYALGSTKRQVTMQGRGSRGAVGHRRSLRAGRLPSDRRDDDRGRCRWSAAQPQPQRIRGDADHDLLHRRGRLR